MSVKDWLKNVWDKTKAFFITNILNLAKDIFAYAVAKALELVPRDTVKAAGYKIGTWFTKNVTPHISERSETEIQEIKDDFNEYLNMGMDSDEQNVN